MVDDGAAVPIRLVVVAVVPVRTNVDAVRANALELSDTARGCGLDSPVPDGAIVSVMSCPSELYELNFNMRRGITVAAHNQCISTSARV